MVDFLKFVSRSVPEAVLSLVSGIVDYALPPVCGNCQEPVLNSNGICGVCWASLTFISDPCCVCCGYPFDYFVKDDVLCGECLRSPKSFDRCRSALSYDDHSKNMIIGFKHADRTYLTKLFTRWIALVGKEILMDVDFISPVPLHPRRLLARRYNQSGLLAQKIAYSHKKVYLPDLLLRTKNTSSQGHLSLINRWKNVRTAFEINPKYADCIRNKNIILIDDVYTTGATLEACSRVLKKQKVAKINVLVLSRVLKESGS
ncbi:ComF family protein [Kiloniella antarctica]|uniref:ComF family protein n=1 Tax=Kiloniella antarctica TaxID=1550907 RepID=A0ABW5BL59_9PROT